MKLAMTISLINIYVSLGNIAISITLILCARSVSRSARLVSDMVEQQRRNLKP
jgi:hypothetical protein